MYLIWQKKNKKVLVINYHLIDNGKDAILDPMRKAYSVRLPDFEMQLKTIIKHNIPIISLHELINNQVSANFSVVITVDDGYYSDYDIIYPIIKSYDIKATFFWLVSKSSDSSYINKGKELINNRSSIGSHGINHMAITKLSSWEQENELRFSKAFFEEKFSKSVDFFAFPYGIYNQAIVKLAKEVGYKAVLTTEVKLNYPEKYPFLIHRWSVKRSTSQMEFEGMLFNNHIFRKKSLISKFKKFFSKLGFNSILDKFNVLIQSTKNDNNPTNSIH